MHPRALVAAWVDAFNAYQGARRAGLDSRATRPYRSSMRVDGRCHCGAIAFEGEVDPDTTTICHCTDCQALTGSAFRAIVRASAASFVLHGTPSRYVKTADSGTQRVHAFCPTCGTPVFSSAIVDPPTYSLRIGTLRQRHELEPQRQNWCDRALPWVMNLESVEKHRRQT